MVNLASRPRPFWIFDLGFVCLGYVVLLLSLRFVSGFKLIRSFLVGFRLFKLLSLFRLNYYYIILYIITQNINNNNIIYSKHK